MHVSLSKWSKDSSLAPFTNSSHTETGAVDHRVALQVGSRLLHLFHGLQVVLARLDFHLLGTPTGDILQQVLRHYGSIDNGSEEEPRML